MAWPPPTPAGADPLHQYLAEYQQQQQQQQHTNMNNQLSASTHAPTTDQGIQSEHASNAPFQTPQVTAMGFQLPQQQASSHSPAGNGVSGQRQSPQRHQQAGGSGGLAPSKSTLETRKSLQARGQNYHFGSGGPQGREWEERQRRDEAMSILESEEMVMWIAGVRNESIPQTRAHYRNIVLGLTQWEHADVAWLDEWEVQQGMGGGASAEGRGMTGGSPARSVKGKERDIAKMRKRVSSGQGHG